MTRHLKNPPNRIREWRKLRRLTQKDLGQSVGLHAVHISNLELGKRELNLSNMRAIARRLDCAVADLLTTNDNPLTLDPLNKRRMAQRIAYQHGDLSLTGHVYQPAGPARAAVLVIPTIAGPNPPIFRRAEMLTELGYVAFVADYYGCEWTDFGSMDEIRAAAETLKADTRTYRDRFLAALTAFRSMPGIAKLKMGMIGYCMGGQVVCELARDGVSLACGVSFHGDLSTQCPASPKNVRTPLLLCHGHLDPLVPPSLVSAFQAEMDAANADWTMHIYSTARHGFTDPESDKRGIAAVAYDRSADIQSWDAMQSFFALHLDPDRRASLP